MKNFPMFLRMDGRRVVLCGGGEDIARKTRLILKTEARIVLVAEELNAELQGLVASGKARHVKEAENLTFQGAALVFIGTEDETEDHRLADLARASGAVINVIDRPELCDAFTPSIVDRDPLVVAIGTEGAAPVLGRAIKTQVESLLPPRLGGMVAMAGRLRDAVAAAITQDKRRAFWEWALNGPPYRAHIAGREEDAEAMLQDAIAQARVPLTPGHIAIVTVCPSAPDLMTMRAVQRMQQADVIIYDDRVGTGVLELARRDADRIFTSTTADEDVIAMMQDAARDGQRVVRLVPAGVANADRPDTDGLEWEAVPSQCAAGCIGACKPA